MLQTSNYNLNKPEGTDVVDISVLNTNFDTIDTTMKVIDNKSIPYTVTSGSANTYTATIIGITAYTAGLRVCVQINVASTGASTLNINSLGAKTILDSLGNAIGSGGLKANIPYQLCYNGTNFIVLGKGGGGTADASKILAPYSATVDSGQVTGSIPSKASATYNPSTSVQTIVAGQYLSGDQTIAPIAGTATDSDVVAGKTYSSASGISRTGTATIESLGGRKYIPGTIISSNTQKNFYHSTDNVFPQYYINITDFSFEPAFVIVMLGLTFYTIGNVSGFALSGSSYYAGQDYVFTQGQIIIPVPAPNTQYTYYIYG